MNISDAEAQNARQRAQAALDGRTAILVLDKNLADRAQAAARAETAASAAQTDADMNAILAEPSEAAAWTKKAEAEAAKAVKAKHELMRTKALQERIPALLQGADDEISATFSEYSMVVAALSEAARSDLAAQLRPIVAQLAQILQRGHALAAAGTSVGELLNETRVINPTKDKFQAFISGSRMILDDCPVGLNDLWRDDPAALVLFEAYKPFNDLITNMRRQTSRIDDGVQRSIEMANREARARSFDNPMARYSTPGTASTRPGSDPVTTPTPSAGEAAHDTTPKLDISVDRKEPLTPGEIETLWRQASGGMAAPMQDAQFLSIIEGRPPWRGQGFIEQEARVAAVKAKRNADLTAPKKPLKGTMLEPVTVRDVTVKIDVTDDGAEPFYGTHRQGGR